MSTPSTTPQQVIPPSPPTAPRIPPLENGDRLSREEFERRYHAMPHLKKAELIEGVVYMPSPVRFDAHAEQHAWLIIWLGNYAVATPGVRVGDNATTRLSETNEPQPDGLLFVDGIRGGQARVDADGYVAGAPDLVGEIAASSVSVDLGPKLTSYRNSGVREYIVWRVQDRAIDWFVLRGGAFQALPISADGVYRSEAFPGLWLDAAAMLAGDLPRVVQALQHGLASPEHAAFVAKLRSSAAPSA